LACAKVKKKEAVFCLIFEKTFYMSFYQKPMSLLFTVTLFVLTFSSCKFREKVPLLVHNAVIYTVNDSFSTAQAMAISDGKILAIGSNDEILKKYEGAETVNAQGKAIFPGFIDAHCHFTGFATDRWKVDLVGTTSWEDIVTKVQQYSTNAPMEWIYGRGWDQNDWSVKAYPDTKILDSLFPTRPVYLERVDGHAAIANKVALRMAGITANTKIVGGSIELRNGEPSGILIDNAMKLVEAKVPEISDSLAKQYYSELQALCFEEGLTGVHDCGVSEHTIELIESAHKSGSLKMKIYALLRDDSTLYDRWVKKGRYTTDRLTVGGFKLYADGALGSRGACLLNEYNDQKGWKGFLLSEAAYFRDKAQKLAGSNLQMCTHAIGDSGNRELLKIYGDVLKGKNDKRWRIEHAQIVHPTDFAYFADYNIIPSVQPTHATSDMYWAAERVGAERMKGAYAYKTLLASNQWMPLGTDFPVEYISPFKTFYAAVVRKDANNFPEGGFQMSEALSRQQTIRGMTIWAAKSAFEEKQKGSLEKGKAADFIMLENDLMTCEEKKILGTKVLGTWVNGERVFGK
jgi:predicted amidohydrolase YtcJ